MFDKSGRKRIDIEYLLPAGTPFGAISLGQSPFLSEFIAADQVLLIQLEARRLAILDDFMADSHPITDKFISETRRGSLQYLPLDSFKDFSQTEEFIANKGILFLHIDPSPDEFLLSKISSAAQKVGTWTVAIISASCCAQPIPQFSTKVDNIISFNNTTIEKSDIWKVSKIINALWHGCKGGGLVCIDASNIEAFLRLGMIGHAGVAIAHGKDCVKDALRKAVYDLETFSTPDSSRKKGVFVSIEVNMEEKYDNVIDTLRNFSREHCANTTDFFTDVYINTTLIDSAIATLIINDSDPSQ